MKFFNRHIFLYILILLVFNQCNRKVAVPAYININQISIQSNYLKQGSNSAAILDAWVYVDGNLAGIYPVPCHFPLIDAGKHTISIQPGIKQNGMSNTRINYPFYGTYDTTIDMSPEMEYTLSPVVNYRDATKMNYFEDFESGGFRLKPSSLNNSDSFVVTSDANEVFEGKSSGRAILKPNKYFEYVSTDNYSLPGNGAETYIEINYKTEADVEVGFYQSAGTVVERYPVMILYHNDEWKKMYIRITEEVSSQLIKYNGQVSLFSIYVKSENTDTWNKRILLDNIKLVTF